MSFPAPALRALRVSGKFSDTSRWCLARIGPMMGWSVPVYAGVSLVPSSPHMSLVLEDSHEIRGLLLRARASDYRFALSSPEQHSGHDNLL